MDRLTKDQFHAQAENLKFALADAVLKVQDIAGLRESATSVIIDAALANASFYAPEAQNTRTLQQPRNAVDNALEQFSAELISLMLTYAAGELPPGFDKLPRPF